MDIVWINKYTKVNSNDCIAMYVARIAIQKQSVLLESLTNAEEEQVSIKQINHATSFKFW